MSLVHLEGGSHAVLTLCRDTPEHVTVIARCPWTRDDLGVASVVRRQAAPTTAYVWLCVLGSARDSGLDHALLTHARAAARQHGILQLTVVELDPP
jgi:hypothetical protein